MSERTNQIVIVKNNFKEYKLKCASKCLLQVHCVTGNFKNDWISKLRLQKIVNFFSLFVATCLKLNGYLHYVINFTKIDFQ